MPSPHTQPQLEDVLPSFEFDSYMLHRNVEEEDNHACPPVYSEEGAPTESSLTLIEPQNDYTQSVFSELEKLEKQELSVKIEVQLTRDMPQLGQVCQPESESRVYYPGEIVTGTVCVTNLTASRIPFKTFLVSLEGDVETPGHFTHRILRSVDLAASYHPGHIPLKVSGDAKWGKRDSVDGSYYGFCERKRLFPGRTYKKFFHFVVPQATLDTVCMHQLEGHLQLPPSSKGFLGSIRYKVVARLVGDKTEEGIGYQEGSKAVQLGREKTPPGFYIESTSSQLSTFQKRAKNLLDDMKGRSRRKARYEDHPEEVREESSEYFSQASIDLPTQLFGNSTETMHIEARSSRNHTVANCKIHLKLSTHQNVPPSHISIEPKLRAIYISSRYSLPITVDAESLLERCFTGRKGTELKRQCLEQFKEIRSLAIEKELTVPAQVFYGLHSLGTMLYNEHTLKGWFDSIKKRKLHWRHIGDSYVAQMEIPLRLCKDAPQPSFQTCYLGRWYEVDFVIKIGKRIVEVALPLNVES